MILSNYQIQNDNIEDFVTRIHPKYRLVHYDKKKLLLETLFVAIIKKDTV